MRKVAKKFRAYEKKRSAKEQKKSRKQYDEDSDYSVEEMAKVKKR